MAMRSSPGKCEKGHQTMLQDHVYYGCRIKMTIGAKYLVHSSLKNQDARKSPRIYGITGRSATDGKCCATNYIIGIETFWPLSCDHVWCMNRSYNIAVDAMCYIDSAMRDFLSSCHIVCGSWVLDCCMHRREEIAPRWRLQHGT